MKKSSLLLIAMAGMFAAACSQAQPQGTQARIRTMQQLLARQQRQQQQAEPQPEQTPAAPAYVDTLGANPLDISGKKGKGYVNPYPQGSYEHFAAQPEYPVTSKVYKNKELLDNITAVNSKIIVCLPQQRARLYVEGKVAYDWPVSTGRDGHETPTGAFRVLEKQPDHKSNRYGKFVSSSGRTVNSNADTAKGVPKNCTFRPASMPHWNRFTWDGVGLHGGRVVPGRRLSHGCIRTPYKVAADLYNYTVQGMPAYITRAVEDYNKGGAVKPIDVKYRPGGDYTDMAQPAKEP